MSQGKVYLILHHKNFSVDSYEINGHSYNRWMFINFRDFFLRYVNGKDGCNKDRSRFVALNFYMWLSKEKNNTIVYVLCFIL